MINEDGKRISICFELGNYSIEHNECEDKFYDVVARFQDENDLDELISKLTGLKETYLNRQ